MTDELETVAGLDWIGLGIVLDVKSRLKLLNKPTGL